MYVAVIMVAIWGIIHIREYPIFFHWFYANPFSGSVDKWGFEPPPTLMALPLA